MKQLTVMMALLAAALLVAPAGAAVYLQDGLVSVWSFDEASGVGNTTAYDSLSYHNDAVFTAGMTTTGSDFSSVNGLTGTGMGNYLQFNGDLGTATAAVVGSPTSLDMGDQVTISMWVRMDKDPTTYGETYMGLLDSQDDNYVLYLERSTTLGGRVRAKAVDSDNTALRWGTGYDDINPLVGSWAHLAMTYDATGLEDGLTLARMYVNGVEVCSALTEASSMGDLRDGQILSFGGTWNTNTSVYYGCFNGGIDEAGVWNRALNPDEIAYLYNGGAGVPILAANPTSSEVNPDPFSAVSSASPLIRYQFEGNMNNVGAGGATYNAATDGPGTNMSYATTDGVNQGQYLKLTNGDITSGGDRVVIPLEVASLTHGTMSFWLREDQAYFYNSIFNCPANNGDWEMWIYGDNRTNKYAGRINSGSVSTNPDLNENGNGGTGVWNHYTFRWVQEESGIECNYQLFLNGELVDTYFGTWAESGMNFFLGGGDGNDYATWSMDDFRLYDVCLDEAAIQNLMVPEPSTIVLILSALAGLGLFLRRR